MPVTNNYVVRYLLEATSNHAHPLRWRELSNGAFAASAHGIRIRLTNCYTKAGLFLFITLSRAGRRTQIEEPRPSGFIRRTYSTPDELELSDLMRSLHAQVRRQCMIRQQDNERDRDKVRKVLLDRLMFGAPSRSRTIHQRETSALLS